ncbi:hypothetical protein D3C72_2490620 [compost metagenome]
MQSVCKLHQKHAHIFGNRKQQLAEVFRLHCFFGNQIKLLELGQTFNKLTNLRAE